MLYFIFSEAALCKHLQRRAKSRLNTAFRPKTKQVYDSLFRVFVGFCVSVKVALNELSVPFILSFLEYLVDNNVSVHMVVNYVLALKAMCIVYGLQFVVFEHPRIRYFIKALKINRPLKVTKRNVIDIPTLQKLILLCGTVGNPRVLKAIFLTAYFGFFRLSNLAPHTVNLTPQNNLLGDVFFETSSVRLLLKWSKEMQTRDKVRVIVLPHL